LQEQQSQGDVRRQAVAGALTKDKDLRYLPRGRFSLYSRKFPAKLYHYREVARPLDNVWIVAHIEGQPLNW
jgi:hypothetical protein